MALFTELVGWANYVSGRLSIAEIEEAEAEAQYDFVAAEALLDNLNVSAHDSVTAAKARRDTDPEVVRKGRACREARAFRKQLATLAGNLERMTALVSRDLTRRVNQEPVSRRKDRWNP